MLIVVERRKCRFIERVNRFTGMVELDGAVVGVHITNTGRLMELLVKGRPCIVYRINGSKLKYRLAGIGVRGGYAVIDTVLQSKAFEKAVELRAIPWLEGCSVSSRNPRVGDSILDYKLECGGRELYVEVKSAVLIGEGGESMYPDCPTIRGQRHVRRLISMAEAGLGVMLVMIAGFPNARCFKPYRQGDPVIYDLITKAYTRGVDVKAISLSMDEGGRVVLENPDLPLCREWINNAVKKLDDR